MSVTFEPTQTQIAVKDRADRGMAPEVIARQLGISQAEVLRIHREMTPNAAKNFRPELISRETFMGLVIRALRDGGPMSSVDLAQKLDMPVQSICRILWRARKVDLVEVAGHDRPTLWRVTRGVK